MKKVTILLLFLGLMLSVNTQAQFSTKANATTNTRTTLEPEIQPDFVYESLPLADTYVLSSSGNTTSNYGNDAVFIVRHDTNTGRIRQGYLMFPTTDLDSITNLDDYILEISIALYPVKTTGRVNEVTWRFMPVKNITWNETEITWKSKPGVSTPMVTEVKGYLMNTDHATTYDSTNVVYANISKYVLAEYKNGNNAISLNVTNDKSIGSSGNAQITEFASKEHTNEQMRPRLIVKAYKKKAQTIDFETAIPLSMKVGDDDFALSATSSSGLPITYTSSNESVIVIEEAPIRSTSYIARVVGAGTTTITATQAGNADYLAITSTQEVTVIDGTVGVETGSDATTLRVYANAQTIYVDATAVSDKFLGNTTIDVYNTLGAKLNTVKAKDAVTPITISTSGVYIIKVLSDGYKQEFKVIVK